MLFEMQNTQCTQGDTMNKTTRKIPLSGRITIFLAAFLIAASSFSFLSHFSFALPVSGYETNTFRDFPQTPLGLENPQFSASGGGVPGTPSGWTETAYPNKEKGSTAMGVLDLDIYDSQESYVTDAKLTEYPEYKVSAPRTPFGTLVDANGVNRKILMVNTTKATETVIGYQSSAVLLAENKFFRISAWVKTGGFYGIHGAAIRLNGISDQNIAFNEIVTAKSDTALTKENLFGWQQYSFYIKTASVRAENVSLALTVGDYYKGKDKDGVEIAINYTASGYAFFGNVEAYEISPTKYNFALKGYDAYSQNIQFIDLSLPAASAGDVKLDFVPAASGALENYAIKSSKDANVMISDLVQPAILDTDLTFNTENNRFNLETTPVSPSGKYSDDGYILALSSYTGGKGINAKYKRTAAGYVSKELTVEKLNYYRLSVWVNTHKISGGAGATLVLTTNVENRQNPEDFLEFRATGCAGDPANAAAYGWAEYAFYIRGSFYRDYTVALGLWLGQEDNLTSGTAMFGNVRFEKLTAAQFMDYAGASAGGAPVDIDSEEAETGVYNGNFSIYDDPGEEDKFPLPVAAWELATPAGISRIGYSRDETFMDAEAIISGIMPTNSAHFERYRQDYGSGAVRPSTQSASVLYMSSDVPNAFCYTSAQISLESAISAITARMRVDNVKGYGASLVLRDGNGIIATIENITDTRGRFNDYTFYVKSDGSRAVNLEIWLGLNERDNYNHTKLSSGNVYVDTVSLSEADEGVFGQKERQYQLDLNLRTGTRDYAVFSYSSFNFTEFDPYDPGFVKYPYLWSISGPALATVAGVRSGIFDSANLEPKRGDIPPSFSNPDRRDENQNLKHNNVLLLENAARTASTVTFDRPFQLNEEAYYRLDVGVKVDLPAMTAHRAALSESDKDGLLKEAGAGATIALTNSDFKFENIVDTALVVDRLRDNEVFKIFTFYVYTGDEARSVQLSFSLGGEKTSQFTAGRLYVNSIAFTDITNTLYEEETAKIKRTTDNVLRADFGKRLAEDTAADTVDKLPASPNNSTWLVIPSILFAAAMLLALGGLVVRRVFDNMAKVRAKKAVSVVKTDYGRKGKGYKEFAGTGDGATDSDESRAYEAFDDTEQPVQAEQRRIYAPVVKDAPAQIEKEGAETPDDDYDAFTESDAEETPDAKAKPGSKRMTDDFVDSFDD